MLKIRNLENEKRNIESTFDTNLSDFSPVNARYNSMIRILNSIHPGDIYYSKWINSDLQIEGIFIGDHPIMIIRYDSNIQKALVVPLTSKDVSVLRSGNTNNMAMRIDEDPKAGFLLLDQIQTIPLIVNGRFILGSKICTVSFGTLKEIRQRICQYVMGNLSLTDCRLNEFNVINEDQRKASIIENIFDSSINPMNDGLKIMEAKLSMMISKIETFSYEFDEMKKLINNGGISKDFLTEFRSLFDQMKEIKQEPKIELDGKEDIIEENIEGERERYLRFIEFRKTHSVLETMIEFNFSKNYQYYKYIKECKEKFPEIELEKKPTRTPIRTKADIGIFKSILEDVANGMLIKQIRINYGFDNPAIYRRFILNCKKAFPEIDSSILNIIDHSQKNDLEKKECDENGVDEFFNTECKFENNRLSIASLYKRYSKFCSGPKKYKRLTKEEFVSYVFDHYSDKVRRTKINKDTDGIIGISLN